MTKHQVTNKVRDIVCDHLGTDSDSIDEYKGNLYDLGADSLDTVELIMKVESEYYITIPDDMSEEIRTVDDIVKVVCDIRGINE